MRNCDNCGRQYKEDIRNVKRGWGLCCSKSCAAKKREKLKPSYNHNRVEANNIRRNNWTINNLMNEKFNGFTDEGYKIYGTTAYDEFGYPVYEVDVNENTHLHDGDNF